LRFRAAVETAGLVAGAMKLDGLAVGGNVVVFSMVSPAAFR